MNQDKKLTVHLDISGEPLKLYARDFERSIKNYTVANLAEQPFEWRGSKEEEVVVVDRWFSPLVLHDVAIQRLGRLEGAVDYLLRQPASKYVTTLNNWLAVVDHFGVDANYRQDFFDLVNYSLLDIVVFAYVKEGDDLATGIRYFNGRELTREEFQKEFMHFYNRYVPGIPWRKTNVG